MAATPPTYRPLFEFLRETGCRIGEARHLTWDDVQLGAAPEIRIRPKSGWKPKSGDQRRVPVTPRLVEVLSRLSRQGRWVFTAPVSQRYPQAGRQFSERRALNALKRILKRLNREGHLHTFRHSFISHALLQVPEPVVRSWVGHVDSHIIRTYTHVDGGVSRSDINRL